MVFLVDVLDYAPDACAEKALPAAGRESKGLVGTGAPGTFLKQFAFPPSTAQSTRAFA